MDTKEGFGGTEQKVMFIHKMHPPEGPGAPLQGSALVIPAQNKTAAR